MRYEPLAKSLQELEDTDSYLDKNSIIAGLLTDTPPEKMEMVVPLLLGRIYPAYVSQETGIGIQQLKEAVGRASGYSIDRINHFMEDIGDLGKVAEKLIRDKKQVTLAEKTLTVEKVFENLRELPKITGKGSVNRKIASISELLADSSPLEAKFIVRTILGDLRIGVAEGRLRDAIAGAFGVSSEEVEHAYMLTTDYGRVAKAVAEGGKEGLSELGLKVGHPVDPMLAQRSESIDEVMERMGGRAAFEIKLDGIRIQPHKKGDEVFLFTRRMEDYTDMFPELEDPLIKGLKPDRAIVDGELVATRKESGRPMPFQDVLRRRRKYDIKDVSEEIPVEIYLFDVLLSGKRTMLDRPYKERREELENIVEPGKEVKLVEQRVLGDPEKIELFRDSAVSQGHEGLLAKDLESSYRAGRREFAWLKAKAAVETLDLVVVGALHGKGRRAGFYGSYVLAGREEESGRLKTVAKCGSGYTDEDLEELTKIFKQLKSKDPHPRVDIEFDCDVYLDPKIVFEVLYEEIQKSPKEKHTSMFGLRFPRYVKIREDKGPEDVDTVGEIARLYDIQEKSKSG